MAFSKYDGKGYVGLVNLGNTCFLNSCVQILNHTYELHEYFDSEKINKIKKNTDDSIIWNEWKGLRTTLWQNNGTISPNKFVFFVHHVAKKKGRELFTGWAQNDMSEFLLFLIECLHNSISRGVSMKITGNIENTTDKLAVECYSMLKKIYTKDYSEISDLFYGIYVSEILSLDGTKKHVIKPEHFFILDLPVLSKKGVLKTLYECFDQFVEKELLENENAWYNEKTGTKENVHKQITFWNFPKIVVITLKRFSPDGSRKIQDLISFPFDLDLTQYITGYLPRQYKYELYGVCNHSGSPQGGHYTAFVKNSTNEWIHFNDTSVDVIRNPDNIITPMAYCLFYRKK
jgi:ubiquitin C-terminal hydrolase